MGNSDCKQKYVGNICNESIISFTYIFIKCCVKK